MIDKSVFGVYKKNKTFYLFQINWQVCYFHIDFVKFYLLEFIYEKSCMIVCLLLLFFLSQFDYFSFLIKCFIGYLRLGCMARDRGQIYEASDWFKEALQVNQVLLLIFILKISLNRYCYVIMRDFANFNKKELEIIIQMLSFVNIVMFNQSSLMITI